MSGDVSVGKGRSFSDDVSFQRILDSVSYSTRQVEAGAPPPAGNEGRAVSDTANFELGTDVLEDAADGPPTDFRVEEQSVVEDKPMANPPPLGNAACLKFRNNLIEIVEELRIRRATDSENEDKINSLIQDRHLLENQLEDASERVRVLEEAEGRGAGEARRAVEARLVDVEVQRSRQVVIVETAERTVRSLKDDIRSLQTAKRDLERTVKEQERRLAQQASSMESCVAQMSQLDELHKAVSRRADQLGAATGKLADNLAEAVRINTSHARVSRHQQCIIQQTRCELTTTRDTLGAERVQRRAESATVTVAATAAHTVIAGLRLDVLAGEKSLAAVKQQLQIKQEECHSTLLLLQQTQALLERSVVSEREQDVSVTRLNQDLADATLRCKGLQEQLTQADQRARDELTQREHLQLELKNKEEKFGKDLAAAESERADWARDRAILQDSIADWSRKCSQLELSINALQSRLNVVTHEACCGTEVLLGDQGNQTSIESTDQSTEISFVQADKKFMIRPSTFQQFSQTDTFFSPARFPARNDALILDASDKLMLSPASPIVTSIHAWNLQAGDGKNVKTTDTFFSASTSTERVANESYMVSDISSTLKQSCFLQSSKNSTIYAYQTSLNKKEAEIGKDFFIRHSVSTNEQSRMPANHLSDASAMTRKLMNSIAADATRFGSQYNSEAAMSMAVENDDMSVSMGMQNPKEKVAEGSQNKTEEREAIGGGSVNAVDHANVNITETPQIAIPLGDFIYSGETPQKQPQSHEIAVRDGREVNTENLVALGEYGLSNRETNTAACTTSEVEYAFNAVVLNKDRIQMIDNPFSLNASRERAAVIPHNSSFLASHQDSEIESISENELLTENQRSVLMRQNVTDGSIFCEMHKFPPAAVLMNAVPALTDQGPVVGESPDILSSTLNHMQSKQSLVLNAATGERKNFDCSEGKSNDCESDLFKVSNDVDLNVYVTDANSLPCIDKIGMKEVMFMHAKSGSLEVKNASDNPCGLVLLPDVSSCEMGQKSSAATSVTDTEFETKKKGVVETCEAPKTSLQGCGITLSNSRITTVMQPGLAQSTTLARYDQMLSQFQRCKNLSTFIANMRNPTQDTSQSLHSNTSHVTAVSKVINKDATQQQAAESDTLCSTNKIMNHPNKGAASIAELPLEPRAQYKEKTEAIPKSSTSEATSWFTTARLEKIIDTGSFSLNYESTTAEEKLIISPLLISQRQQLFDGQGKPRFLVNCTSTTSTDFDSLMAPTGISNPAPFARTAETLDFNVAGFKEVSSARVISSVTPLRCQTSKTALASLQEDSNLAESSVEQMQPSDSMQAPLSKEVLKRMPLRLTPPEKCIESKLNSAVPVLSAQPTDLLSKQYFSPYRPKGIFQIRLDSNVSSTAISSAVTSAAKIATSVTSATRHTSDPVTSSALPATVNTSIIVSNSTMSSSIGSFTPVLPTQVVTTPVLTTVDFTSTWSRPVSTKSMTTATILTPVLPTQVSTTSVSTFTPVLSMELSATASRQQQHVSLRSFIESYRQVVESSESRLSVLSPGEFSQPGAAKRSLPLYGSVSRDLSAQPEAKRVPASFLADYSSAPKPKKPKRTSFPELMLISKQPQQQQQDSQSIKEKSNRN